MHQYKNNHIYQLFITFGC